MLHTSVLLELLYFAIIISRALFARDIITLGDFSITNKNNCTWMTFGLPSIHNYDYVEYVENIKRKRLKPGLPGSNITPKKKKRR